MIEKISSSNEQLENDICEILWRCFTFKDKDEMKKGIGVEWSRSKKAHGYLEVRMENGPVVTMNPFEAERNASYVVFGERYEKIWAVSVAGANFDLPFDYNFAILVYDVNNQKLKEFMKNKRCIYRFCQEQEKFEKFEKEITDCGLYLVVSE